MAENLKHDPGIDFTFPFPLENNDVWIWNLLMQTENLSAPSLFHVRLHLTSIWISCSPTVALLAYWE